MSEFIMLYRRTLEVADKSMGTPERAQQSITKWRAWLKELTDKNILKDVGQPLDNAGMVVTGPRKLVTDGPYAESKDIIGGYSIINADDLTHAAHIAGGCPLLEFGGCVEVRPVMKLDI
ncbi:MAG: YciI family protein [Steroidobacter sp.]